MPVENCCKFCGSTDIGDAQFLSHYKREFGIAPKLDTTALAATTGAMVPVDPNLSYNRQNESAIAFHTKVCRTCWHIDCLDANMPNTPMVIVSSETREKIIVPFPLVVIFTSYGYDVQGIGRYMFGLKRKLTKIREKWLRDGNIPCKDGRYGFKLEMRLEDRRGPKLESWVIPSTDAQGVVLRLTFGGKVQCR